jgi:hypothetical protein
MTLEIIGSATHPLKTFLSRPEWIERAWKLLPTTPHDELVGALLDFQALLQQSHDLSHRQTKVYFKMAFVT